MKCEGRGNQTYPFFFASNVSLAVSGRLKQTKKVTVALSVSIPIPPRLSFSLSPLEYILRLLFVLLAGDLWFASCSDVE